MEEKRDLNASENSENKQQGWQQPQTPPSVSRETVAETTFSVGGAVATKKVWYKRKLVWIIGAVVLLLLIIRFVGESDRQPSSDKGNNGTKETESSFLDKKDVEPLEIINSGYTTISYGDSDEYYIHYGITIRNPNEKLAIEYPKFRISAKSEDGSILGTDEQTLAMIYPGQELTWASLEPFTYGKPHSVEFEIIPFDESDVLTASKLEVTAPAILIAENVKKQKESVTGQIKNGNDYSIDQIVVVLLFKDENGKAVGGDTTFVDQLSVNATVSFEVDFYDDYETDNFDVYAYVLSTYRYTGDCFVFSVRAVTVLRTTVSRETRLTPVAWNIKCHNTSNAIVFTSPIVIKNEIGLVVINKKCIAFHRFEKAILALFIQDNFVLRTVFW